MLTGDLRAMTKATTSVVCDAGPIIHLDELGSLYLMRDFERVVVPEGVYQEVLRHRPGALIGSEIKWSRIKSKTTVEESLRIMCQMFSLDVGETEALAILNEEPDCIFLTDDAAARVVATRLGFKVHGTIGVLIRAIRRGFMKNQEVIDLLYSLPSKSSLHIKATLLDEIISLVKAQDK
jgi:predicted nucleic acid-binding protein